MRLYSRVSRLGLLIIVSLGVALALLGWTALLLFVPGIPGPTGDDWVNRAQASAAILAGFALFFSIVATMITARLSTSDFKAAEDVKADTAKLLASLRSIQVKCASLSQDPNSGINFVAERKAVTDLLNSTTGWAYWSLVGMKGEAAGGTPEGWRIFFLHLVRILELPDRKFPSIATSAIQIENLITSLDRDDMQTLAGYVSDLSAAVTGFRASRRKDTLLQALDGVWGKDEEDEMAAKELLRRKLTHLKKKGISDPNIELFLAVTDPDDGPELTKAAIEQGADLKMTDEQLLEKYRDELKDFDEQAS